MRNWMCALPCVFALSLTHTQTHSLITRCLPFFRGTWKSRHINCAPRLECIRLQNEHKQIPTQKTRHAHENRASAKCFIRSFRNEDSNTIIWDAVNGRAYFEFHTIQLLCESILYCFWGEKEEKSRPRAENYACSLDVLFGFCLV